MIKETSETQDMFKKIQEKVANALKNSTLTSYTSLVAVSKKQPLEKIQAVYDLGHREFGENYVEEFVEKAEKMPQDIKWHFIGHLQSNKVNKVIIPQLYCLQTIDSVKLAKKVDNNCAQKNRSALKVYVQVKTSTEETKHGVDKEASFEVIQSVLEAQNLELVGLMTIGMQGDLDVFKEMREFRTEVCAKFGLEESKLGLSMGMSADFEKAVKIQQFLNRQIEQGATCVRVGSSIFGERQA